MQSISIQKFAEMTAKANKDVDRRKLVKDLEATLETKKNGAKCVTCGAPIWAAGSAVTGTNMCFSCITGEAEDSDDYEVE